MTDIELTDLSEGTVPTSEDFGTGTPIVEASFKLASARETAFSAFRSPVVEQAQLMFSGDIAVTEHENAVAMTPTRAPSADRDVRVELLARRFALKKQGRDLPTEDAYRLTLATEAVRTVMYDDYSEQHARLEAVAAELGESAKSDEGLRRKYGL